MQYRYISEQEVTSSQFVPAFGLMQTAFSSWVGGQSKQNVQTLVFVVLSRFAETPETPQVMVRLPTFAPDEIFHRAVHS